MSQSSATERLINPFYAYLGGVASWFANMGLQFVMIPTLAVIYLETTATKLALVQICLSVPQILLLLFAGALADRTNGRSVLVNIHLIATIPPIILGWLVWSGDLEYWHLIVYALSAGVISSFSAPTRDAMLTRVARTSVQSAVMMALITQFAAQLIGFSLAGLAAPVAGPWALLAMQVVVMAFGLVCALALPSLPPKAPKQKLDTPDRGWRTGVDAVIRSPTLYPVILSTISVGIFFIGIFMVALPLIVRNVFGGGQMEISIMNFCFWGGTIFTSLMLLRSRPIERRGRAMAFAQFAGSISLILVVFAPNFVTLCALITCWGLAAGVNMAMGRTVVQIEAPEHARARVLAIYNMGFLGAAPIGAMLTGLAAEWVGPQMATGLFAGMMLVFTVWFIMFTPVLNIRRHRSEV